MILLLDTHLLLWAAGEPKKLSRQARRLLENESNQLVFSAASIWEIAIKSALGRRDFQVEPRRLRRGLLDNRWLEIGITSEHSLATIDLPPLHNDPFDRMLLAQARADGLMLVTSDDQVAQYPGNIAKV